MTISFFGVAGKILLNPGKAYRYLCSWLLSSKFASRGRRFYMGKDSVVIGAKYIYVGNNFSALDRNRIEALDSNRENHYTPVIRIGNNVNIQYDCHFGAVNLIEIGDNVLIGSRVYIADHSHGTTTLDDMVLPPEVRKVISTGPVLIEENVWIGEGVAILQNVRIGRNSIVGANAVVTKDVPPFSVVAGVPAKVIKSFNGLGALGMSAIQAGKSGTTK